MRTAPPLVFMLAAALLSACAGGDTAAPTFTTVDSAGVSIVEHGPLPDRTAFVLGEPLFRHGWRDGDFQFTRLFAAALMSDGRVAAGDLATGDLVMLSATGALDTILGGKGEGPAEFGSLMSIHVLSGDTLLIEDDGNMRLAYFHDGRVARTVQFEGFASFMSRAIGIVDGTLIGEPTAYRPFFDEPWLSMPIVRQPSTGEPVDTLIMYDFVAQAIQDQPNNPFRPRGSVGISGSDLLLARGDHPQVRVVDTRTGELTRVVRWSETPPQMTDEFWDLFAEPRLARVDPSEAAEARTELAAMRPLAEGDLPVIGSVWGDPLGRTWVGQYHWGFTLPNRLKVFGPRGEWLGFVDLPAHVQILEITEDRILGIETDDFDVQAIAVWELERAGSVP